MDVHFFLHSDAYKTLRGTSISMVYKDKLKAFYISQHIYKC